MAVTFHLAVYLAGASPAGAYTLGSGWNGTPVYTDSDADPGSGSTYQFTPDAS